MTSKFPFGYLSKMELSDIYGLDLPSQLQLLPSYELRSNFPGYLHLKILTLMKTMYCRSTQSTLTFLHLLDIIQHQEKSAFRYFITGKNL